MFRSLRLLALVAALFASVAASKSYALAPVVRSGFAIDDESKLKKLEPEGTLSPYGAGYEEEADGTILCSVAKDGEEGKGAKLVFQVNQKEASPLVATGWSCAEGVEGAMGSDYSLYLDVIYEDGTPLWGQIAPFPTGDADWNRAKVVILPDKPVKTVYFYAMFRGHKGKARFKQLELSEFEHDGKVTYFDGSPVELSDDADAGLTGDRILVCDRSPDAKPEWRGASLDSLVTSQDFNDFGGFGVYLHDISADMEDAGEITLHLELQTDEDRVFTLYYVVPLPEEFECNPYWFDSPRSGRETASGERSKTRTIAEAGCGRSSMYPFGAVGLLAKDDKLTPDGDASETSWDGRKPRYKGIAGLGVAPDAPAFFRISSNGPTRELYAAFDLALTKENPRAELKIFKYGGTNRIPFGSTPFRNVYDSYRRFYHDAFAVRAVKQGNWMAFAKISKVPNWEDFGFQFKEGMDEVEEDDARGITTFRYTEPMTWWQQIAKSETSPKSIEAAIKTAREAALENKRKENGEPAYFTAESQALFATGFRDAKGELVGRLLDTPWCDGVVWSMNDAPGLVELNKAGKLRNEDNAALYDAGVSLPTGFEVKWNEKIATDLYGWPLENSELPSGRSELAEAESQPGLDGEYIDSSEGYVTAVLDFNRLAFAGMRTPLTFDAQTRQPGIFRGLIAYEYAKAISEDMHARGKLAMANATPSLHFWLAPLLDVLGTETNWNWGGSWRPMPDEELMYRRAMCGAKPYCFLMNTDFTEFGAELTDRYMQRSLAYGMFPSFFSPDASSRHYFENAELYERDRPTFKKWLPLIKRVAEAGWESHPMVWTGDRSIIAERFGSCPSTFSTSWSSDPVFLTVFNDSQEEKEIRLTLAPALAKHAKGKARELAKGREVAFEEDGKVLVLGSLEAQEVMAVELGGSEEDPEEDPFEP